MSPSATDAPAFGLVSTISPGGRMLATVADRSPSRNPASCRAWRASSTERPCTFGTTGVGRTVTWRVADTAPSGPSTVSVTSKVPGESKVVVKVGGAGGHLGDAVGTDQPTIVCGPSVVSVNVTVRPTTRGWAWSRAHDELAGRGRRTGGPARSAGGSVAPPGGSGGSSVPVPPDTSGAAVTVGPLRRRRPRRSPPGSNRRRRPAGRRHATPPHPLRPGHPRPAGRAPCVPGASGHGAGAPRPRGPGADFETISARRSSVITPARSPPRPTECRGCGGGPTGRHAGGVRHRRRDLPHDRAGATLLMPRDTPVELRGRVFVPDLVEGTVIVVDRLVEPRPR